MKTDMGSPDRKCTPSVAAVRRIALAAGWLASALALAPGDGLAQTAPAPPAEDAAPDAPPMTKAERLDALFAELQDPQLDDWQAVEKRIRQEWSHSGSAAMDLLLERGRAAMARGDYAAAIEHLTALTDHAPDFAEGWNARATAFFEMDEYGLSVADIRRTLALEPRHFGALAGLGMIYERLDRPGAALKAYEAALAVHPYRPDLRKAVKRLREQVRGVEL